MSKTMHMCITFEGALKEWQYMTTTKNGRKRKATLKEVKEAVEEARSKGYEVLPPCDNVDKRGMCKGHDTELLTLNEKYKKLENNRTALKLKLYSTTKELDDLVENAVKDGYNLDLDSGKWEKE